MAFDNKYPYTDFHELNLDWFMGEFKKLVAEWEETRSEWITLHDYVQNYFENLDVQTEIDNKINAMILDGTFADIVSPFVTAALPALVAGQLPDVVAAQISAVVAAQISAVVADQLPAVAAAAAAAEVGTWLAAHIDPDTGYVIDDSLTVSQAAADAKTVGDNINALKNDIVISIEDFHLVAFPQNRYNPAYDTDNGYVKANGDFVSNNDYFVTGYMAVKPAEAIYFWGKNSSDVYANFNKRFVCAYDRDKNAIAAAGISSITSMNPFTVPADIYFIRVSVAKTEVTGFTELYCGTNGIGVGYTPYGFKLQNQNQVDENSQGITENTELLDKITRYTSNLLDTTKIITGKYRNKSGDLRDNVDLSLTDIMEVNEGDLIYAWGRDGDIYKAMSFRFICALDSNKEPVPASGRDTLASPPYTVPSGIKYIQLSFRNTELAYDNLYVGTHTVGEDYKPYGKELDLPTETSFNVNNGDSILESVMYCYEHGIKSIIVNAGDYDIISEYESFFGIDYFSDYTGPYNGLANGFYDRGLWIDGLEVFFRPGSKVVAHYEGDNAYVKQYFSAFAVGSNAYIEGLTLDATNMRYGIHPDFHTDTNHEKVVFKGCDLHHYKASNQSNQCIGCGLGVHELMILEDCIFRSDGENIVWRFHNNVSSEAQSKVIMTGCYFVGEGYAKFNSYSTSELMTDVLVSNCSWITPPLVSKESPESNVNVQMISWNNETRDS